MYGQKKVGISSLKYTRLPSHLLGLVVTLACRTLYPLEITRLYSHHIFTNAASTCMSSLPLLIRPVVELWHIGPCTRADAYCVWKITEYSPTAIYTSILSCRYVVSAFLPSAIDVVNYEIKAAGGTKRPHCQPPVL